MSYSEFVLWLAYNSISPISDERCFDLGHARQQRTLVQMHSKKGKKVDLDDFMPFSINHIQKTMDEKLLDWAMRGGAIVARKKNE